MVVRERLESLNVLSLPTLGSLDHVELNGLTFLERTETVRLDGGEVHENIFTVCAADKAKTLSIVKPLNSTLFHWKHPLQLDLSQKSLWD